ncbi:hypothetical protein [Peribacillus acanthi]|nr:hypothetical protein [Peribacillus acanthi]
MLYLILIVLFFVMLLMLAELITLKKEAIKTRKTLDDLYDLLNSKAKSK